VGISFGACQRTMTVTVLLVCGGPTTPGTTTTVGWFVVVVTPGKVAATLAAHGV
jgi:hypothetical protein